MSDGGVAGFKFKLSRGETVDFPHAVALLGPDAGLEDNTLDSIRLDRGPKIGGSLSMCSKRVAIGGGRTHPVKCLEPARRFNDRGPLPCIECRSVRILSNTRIECAGVAQQGTRSLSGLYQHAYYVRPHIASWCHHSDGHGGSFASSRLGWPSLDTNKRCGLISSASDEEAVAVVAGLASFSGATSAEPGGLYEATSRTYGRVDILLPARLRP